MSSKNLKEDKKEFAQDNTQTSTESTPKVETSPKKEDKITYLVIANQSLTSFFEVNKKITSLTLNPEESIIVDNCEFNEDVATKLIQLNFIKKVQNA